MGNEDTCDLCGDKVREEDITLWAACPKCQQLLEALVALLEALLAKK